MPPLPLPNADGMESPKFFGFSPGGTNSAAETCYTVSIQYSKWSLKQNLIPKQDLGTAWLSVPRRVFVETPKMFQGLMNGELCLMSIFCNFQAFCSDGIIQTVPSTTSVHRGTPSTLLGFFANS